MAITEQVKQQLFDNNETPIRLTSLSAATPAYKRRIRDRRRPGAKQSGEPWTKDEHERFLAGLQAFPSGPWKMVAAYVQTRTTRQTMTHAQKYRQKIKRRQLMAHAVGATGAAAAPTSADAAVTRPSSDSNTIRAAAHSQVDVLSTAATTASAGVAPDTTVSADAALHQQSVPLPTPASVLASVLASLLAPAPVPMPAPVPVLATVPASMPTPVPVPALTQTPWLPRAMPTPTPYRLPSLHTSIQRGSSAPADLQSLQPRRDPSIPALRDQAYASVSSVAPRASEAAVPASLQQHEQQRQRQQRQQQRPDIQRRTDGGATTGAAACAPASLPQLRRTASHEAIAALLSNYSTILDDGSGDNSGGNGDDGDGHDSGGDDDIVHLSDRLCELFVDPNQL